MYPNQPFLRLSLISSLFGIALPLTLLAWSPVNADQTIVASIHVGGLVSPTDGSSQPAVDLTVTTYIQGDRTRTDSSDGASYLFDSTKGEVYQLEPGASKYRITTIKDLTKLDPDVASPGQHDLSVSSELSTGDSINTATYINTTTTDIPLVGDAEITRRETINYGSDSHNGGRRRSGGSSGPGGGGSADTGVEPQPNSGSSVKHVTHLPLPTYTLQGDLWVSARYLLPKQKHVLALPLALQMMWGGGPLVHDLSDTLSSLGNIPLHSEITVVKTSSGQGNDSASGQQSSTVITTFNVKTVNNQPLDRSLFVLPADYTVDPAPIELPRWLFLARQATITKGHSVGIEVDLRTISLDWQLRLQLPWH